MNIALPCPVCGCSSAAGAAIHPIVAALIDDDLDRAIECGLLVTSGCTDCSAACSAVLLAARDVRLGALAARERYRQRDARLQRRAAERAARRAPAPGPAIAADPSESAQAARPALPSAAAAALARAKARADERRKS